MVSASRHFRQMIRIVSLVALVLLLSGCASPVQPQFTAPGNGSAPPAQVPDGPVDRAPSVPPNQETPELPSPPEEAILCGFRKPAETICVLPGPEGTDLIFSGGCLLSADNDGPRNPVLLSQSLDGGTGILLEGSRLWLVREQSLLSLGEWGGLGALSADGSVLVFTDRAGILCRYDCGSGDTLSISAAVRSAAVAPDGSCIAYSTANPDGSTTAWLWEAGTARLLGEEMLPLGLAGGGQLIYALGTEDSRLHILDDTGAAVGPALLLDDGGKIFLSADHRQILFPSDGVWYLSSGGEAIAATDAALEAPLLPRGCPQNVQNSSVFTLPTGNLWGNFFMDTQGTLFYMEPGREAAPVSDGVQSDSLRISWDGNAVFYLWEDGTLFRTDRDCPGSPTILASDISRFCPTAGNNSVYCLDSQGTLWYLEDFHDPKAIQEGVTEFFLTWDDYCLYLASGEEEEPLLLASHAGSPGTLLSSRISLLHTTPTAAYYISEASGLPEIYCAAQGIAFLPIESNTP